MAVRSISAEGLRDIFAQHTASAIFALVTFYSDDTSRYIGVVNNNGPIVHNGVEYIGLPFQFELPSNDDEQVPQLTMTIDNVDRTLVDLLRGITEAPPVTVEVIRVTQAGETATELGPMDFSLLSADTDAAVVVLQIGYTNDILNSPATGEIFNPGTAPALFSS
ncbi:hypothetical protein GY26_01820 [Gammaproteobacteria bacterium MFB021]|nr:hypothetical protein GY26_01820 [Gammaproteobacteria bacterium MFB021]